MNNILNSVLENLGDQGIVKIANTVGVDKDTASSLIKTIGPVVIAKMGRNTESSEGLSALSAAIEKDHNGDIFNRVDDLVNPNVDTKGDKIMNHVFGGSELAITKTMAEEVNVSNDAVGGLMEIIGPLVLGQIGKMKSDSGNSFDMGILGDLLKSERQEVAKGESNMLMSLAENFLDKDNDGSITDDVIDIAKGFLK